MNIHVKKVETADPGSCDGCRVYEADVIFTEHYTEDETENVAEFLYLCRVCFGLFRGEAKEVFKQVEKEYAEKRRDKDATNRD